MTPTTDGAPTSFIIRQAGEDFHAPDVTTLRTWAREGRIRPNSYVFHPALNRWIFAEALAELSDSFHPRAPASISKLAESYRQLVLWVGAQILVSIALMVVNDAALVLVPALLATTAGLGFYAFRTAEALGSPTAPLWGVAMLVPCINLLTLLVLSTKATDTCKANGVPVGLFGPRV